MLRKGLISTSSCWIEKAVKQKKSGFPVALANSKLLTYDKLDRKLISLVCSN